MMVMTLREQRWSRWSRWLGKFPARQIDLALALLVTLTGLILFAFAGIGGSTRAGFLFLQNVEQRSLDAMFKSRGPRPVDDHIVIVAIDDNTLLKVGAWPIPRSEKATGNSFTFSYKFEPTAPSCAGGFGPGVVTINSFPWATNTY